MAPIGRTIKQPQPAIVQWDNGRGKWRDIGTTPWNMWPCFHVETGRNEEFDRAMHAADVSRIEFFHPAKNGRPSTITQDWMLGTFIDGLKALAAPPTEPVRQPRPAAEQRRGAIGRAPVATDQGKGDLPL